MSLSHFPHGMTSFGVPIYGGAGGPLGIGVGKVRYVVAARATTNLYYNQLRNVNGIKDADIYTTVATAYAATTASQNDVIVVMPGAHVVATEIAWSKSSVHMVGAGGPNTNGDWSEPNVVIYSSATDCASTITVTGNNCQFYNVTISNYGNNAACLTPFTLNSYGCYFSNCAFQGNMTTNQNTTVAAASLYIAGGGMYPVFDNCTIGQDVWGVRSGANSGQLRFTGSVQPNGGWLRHCRIPSRSVTATCAAVALPANGAIGRGWIFDNCIFSNEYASPFTNLTHVFYDNDAAGQSFLLRQCTAVGYAQWQSADRRIFADMPIVGTGGGLCAEPTSATGS